MKRWLGHSQLARAHGKPEAGYTITEVMVVMAVSAMMFVAIALMFSGRQAEVEFNQSVRNYEATLQNTMNEVASGYYGADFRCTAPGEEGSPSISMSMASPTGTNESCIFLGKIIMPDSGDSNSDVSTVVGRRIYRGRDVETLAEASPIIVESATNTVSHSFGLRVRQIQRLSDNSRVYGLGFINPLAQGSSLAQGDESGGEGLIKLYGFTSPNLSGEVASQLTPLSDGAVLCVEGHNGQFAEIIIGENNSQSTIISVLDTAEEGERCSGL